jgi:DNA-binding CsgD family transcriptional regulator
MAAACCAEVGGHGVFRLQLPFEGGHLQMPDLPPSSSSTTMPSVRDSLGLLLSLRGYRTAIFADAESFLNALSAGLARLRSARHPHAGHGRPCPAATPELELDCGLTVDRHDRAWRRRVCAPRLQGAGCRFPGKAARPGQADGGDRRCPVHVSSSADTRTISAPALPRRLATLTPREREVMEHDRQRRPQSRHRRGSWASARARSKVHKARVMQKLQVDGVAQLVRYSLGNC